MERHWVLVKLIDIMHLFWEKEHYPKFSSRLREHPEKVNAISRENINSKSNSVCREKHGYLWIHWERCQEFRPQVLQATQDRRQKCQGYIQNDRRGNQRIDWDQTKLKHR